MKSFSIGERGTYHLRWRGEITGPLALEDVLRLLRENKITPKHQISANGVKWHSISEAGLLGSGKPFVQKSSKGAAGNSASNRYVDSSRPQNIEIANETLRANDDPSINRAGSHHRWRISALIIIGTLPLAIAFVQTAFRLRFEHVAWLFSLYFCGLWAWIAGLMIPWRAEVWRRAFGCGAFTCFVGILMLYAWYNIPIVANLWNGIDGDNAAVRLVALVLGVGLMEELCKAIPLILFCMGPRYILSPNDGLFYGLLSGLGFATREGVNYTIDYWAQAVGVGAAGVNQAVEDAVSVYGTLNRDAFEARLYEILPRLFEHYGEIVTVQFVRFMTLPLLHAAWAGLAGYTFALAFKRRNWLYFLGGVGMASVLHGVYNYFANGFYGLAIALVTLMIPILLVQHTRKMAFA